MTDVSYAETPVRQRSRRSELWEFRALVAATYPLFLAAAIFRRVTGTSASGVETRRSVFAEAHASAAATLALAFAG